MAKRAAPADASDDDQSHSSKRARQSDPSSQVEEADMQGDDEHVHKEDHIEDDDDEGGSDEEEMQAKARKLASTQTQKKTGTAAQAGIIQSIEVTDFMCHPKMTLKLGNRINFVVGHNGSGKSAFLSALVVALGGKAAATGRGSGIKDFVRNEPGVTKATVTVRLANKGPDAWKPEVYGDSILVTRSIMRESGGGGYKIANSAGKTIETKREELTNITDHFSISVDNPINVLSQDNARQFLHNSSPQEKYAFFLRGTMLQQLTEEYDQLRQLTREVKASIERQKQIVPQLKKELQEAVGRQKSAEAAQNQAAKLEEAKKCLAWSFVVEVEKKMEEQADKLADEESRVPQIEAELERFKANLDEVNERFTALEAEVTEEENGNDGLDAELAEIKKQLKDNLVEIRGLNNDGREMMSAIKEAQQRATEFRASLEAELAKNAEDTDGPRQQQLAELQRLKDQREELQSTIAEAKREANALVTQAEEGGNEYRDLKNDLGNAQRDVQSCESAINQARRSQTDPLAAYGNNVKGVIDAIQRDNWVGSRPVGPLGRFMTLKDQRWSSTIESVFGAQLNGFVCSDNRDKGRLANLLKRFNMHSVPIFCNAANHRLDQQIQQADPGSQFVTVYKVLGFSDELVRTAVVNMTRPESSILVATRPEGDRIMQNPPRGVQTCYSEDGYRLGGVRGGRQQVPLNMYRGTPRLTKDVSSVVARFEADKQQAERRLQEVLQRRDQMDVQLADLNRRRVVAVNRAKAAQDRDQKLAYSITTIEDNMIVSEPVNVAHMEQNVQQQEDMVEGSKTQLAANRERLEALTRANRPLVDERDAHETRKRAKEAEIEEKRTRAKAALDARNQSQSNVRQYENKLNNQRTKVAAIQTAYEETTEKCQTCTEQAEIVCDDRESLPLDPKKGPKEYDAEVRAKTKALSITEKRQGMSIDDINHQVEKTQTAYGKANAASQELNGLFKALKKAYAVRMDKWDHFRRYITVRARMQFIKHLSTRGYSGKLTFNHDKKRLDIRVQTEECNTQATQKQQKDSFKDAKSLSGGEKSFSTVSLLLTLWESIGCPIRALDEFDVFMDPVNRRIAMGMMIEGARQTNETQFILISPNAMANVAIGQDIKVLRVADPQRNQGRLGAGN